MACIDTISKGLQVDNLRINAIIWRLGSTKIRNKLWTENTAWKCSVIKMCADDLDLMAVYWIIDVLYDCPEIDGYYTHLTFK